MSNKLLIMAAVAVVAYMQRDKIKELISKITG